MANDITTSSVELIYGKLKKGIEEDRKAVIARNSFPGPDNNRFIDAFMRKQRCSHEARRR